MLESVCYFDARCLSQYAILVPCRYSMCVRSFFKHALKATMSYLTWACITCHTLCMWTGKAQASAHIRRLTWAFAVQRCAVSIKISCAGSLNGKLSLTFASRFIFYIGLFTNVNDLDLNRWDQFGIKFSLSGSLIVYFVSLIS